MVLDRWYSRTLTLGLFMPVMLQAQSTQSFHSNVNLVVVDVVANDSHERPIEHLTASDFTVLEDGHPQKIKVFEEHSSQQAAERAPSLPASQPGIFTNRAAIPKSGVLNVVLLDKLNTALKDQSFLNSQLLRYFKNEDLNANTAVFGLTSQLRMLQGFTTDANILREFASGKKGKLSFSPLFDNITQDSSETVSALNNSAIDAEQNEALADNLQQFEANQQSFQQQMRIEYTLDGLNQLARYLSSFPGRKNILWFSGSFPINILPDGDLSDPFLAVFDREEEYRETVNLLTKSQVAVYPIDVRGIVLSPLVNAADSGSKYARNPQALLKDDSKFLDQQASEHSTMQLMAKATGGEAFVNSNDITGIVKKVVEISSHYYTLAYSPDGPQWDGKYHHIRVTVDRHNTTLSFRQGYYADDPDKPLKPTQPLIGNGAALSAYSPVRTAFLHGAPESTEIQFDVVARQTTKALEPKPLDNNLTAYDVKGPFKTYQVLFSVNPSDTACESTTDKKDVCRAIFRSNVYDEDGRFINQQSDAVKIMVPQAALNSTKNTKLLVHQKISIPLKGTYFLRMGVVNPVSGRIGTVEVPITLIDKFPDVAPFTD